MGVLEVVTFREAAAVGKQDQVRRFDGMLDVAGVTIFTISAELVS